MRLRDLPPSLRKFAMHSHAVPAAGISRVTGIPARDIRLIRTGHMTPTEQHLKLLGAYFNVTPEVFLAALPLLKEWSLFRRFGRLPVA